MRSPAILFVDESDAESAALLARLAQRGAQLRDGSARRVVALTTPETAGGAIYRHRGLEVELEQRRARVNRREVRLTAHEFAVLALLARSPGKIWTIPEIFESVWGTHYSGEAAYIWTYIRRLRRKLEAEPDAPIYVLSRHGRGYFVPASDEAPSRTALFTDSSGGTTDADTACA